MSDPGPLPPSSEYVAKVTSAQRALYGLIMTLVRRASDADDVLQETNLVLWRKAAEYDPGRPFMPWAMQIARIQSRAYLSKRQRLPLADSDLLDRIAAAAIAAQGAAESRRLALAGCLQKLPEKHRVLIATRYEPGASVNAIAAARATQPKAVSEMLRRIRRTLLECIERTLAVEAAT
jgi:RNA polymerase sigma-70 factor, ECF subfamily